MGICVLICCYGAATYRSPYLKADPVPTSDPVPEWDSFTNMFLIKFNSKRQKNSRKITHHE
jgi:hypothetical protein